MANISSLAVQMTAKTGRFEHGMGRAGRSVERFGQTVNRRMTVAGRVGQALSSLAQGAGNVAAAGLKATAAGALAAAAGVTAATYIMTKGVRSVAEEIDALSKSSRDLGANIGGLGALNFAAKFADVSSQEIAGGLAKMQKRISEVAAGAKVDPIMSQILGDTSALSRLTSDQQFLVIGKRLQGITNHTDRLRVAFDLFGRGTGVKMLRLLPDDILAASTRMRLFGQEVSALDGSNIERMNDGFTALREMAKGVFVQLAIRIAPAVAHLIEQTEAWATSGGGLAVKIGGALDLLGDGILRVARTFESTFERMKIVGLMTAAAITGAFVGSFDLMVKASRGMFKGLDRFLPGNPLSAAAEAAFKDAEDMLAEARAFPQKLIGDALATALRASVSKPERFNLGESLAKWWQEANTSGVAAMAQKVANPLEDLLEEDPIAEIADRGTEALRGAADAAEKLMRVLDPGSAISGTAGTIALRRFDRPVIPSSVDVAARTVGASGVTGGSWGPELVQIGRQILMGQQRPVALEA